MQLQSFSALTFHSADPARLAAFYRDALGIPLAPDRHGATGEHFECELGDVHLAVLKRTAYSGAMVPVFRVDDLDAARARMASLGVEGRHDPLDLGGGMRVVTFTDPDGNGFRLIEIPAAG